MIYLNFPSRERRILREKRGERRGGEKEREETKKKRKRRERKIDEVKLLFI